MSVHQKRLTKSAKHPMAKNGNRNVMGEVTADSTDLSWAAETADGTRDQMLVLALEDGKNLKVKRLNELENPRDKLVSVFTRNKQVRPKVERVEIYVEGRKQPIELPGTEPWDAVFWTESSVEKFLWPYYHSHRLWDPKMTELQAKFEGDPTAVAVAHKAPSASLTLPRSGIDLCGVARAVKDEQGILALAWLAGREYLALKEGG